MEPHPEVQEPRGEPGDQVAAACLKVDRCSHLDHLTICSATMHFVDDLMGASEMFSDSVFFDSTLLSPRFTSKIFLFSRLRQHEALLEPHPEVEAPGGESGDQAAAACLKVDGPGSHLDHITICSDTMHIVEVLKGDPKCLVFCLEQPFVHDGIPPRSFFLSAAANTRRWWNHIQKCKSHVEKLEIRVLPLA